MAIHGGADPRLSARGQKLFEDFKAQRAKDQMYNKEEAYFELNPNERNSIFGAHSKFSRDPLGSIKAALGTPIIKPRNQR